MTVVRDNYLWRKTFHDAILSKRGAAARMARLDGFTQTKEGPDAYETFYRYQIYGAN